MARLRFAMGLAWVLVVGTFDRAHADKNDKPEKSEKETRRELLARFDRNRDEALNKDERIELRTAFADEKDPSRAALKALDTNRNGKLDDNEIELLERDDEKKKEERAKIRKLQERLEKERKEQARLERQRREKEREARERKEKERRAKERREKERREKERKEKAREEKERRDPKPARS